LREADLNYSQHDPWSQRHQVLGLIAQVHALIGKPKEAASILAEAQSLQPSFDSAHILPITEAAAWLAAQVGELSLALARTLAGAEHARSFAATLYELAHLQLATRLGQARQVMGRLSDIAAVTEGALAPAFASFAHASANDDADALERSAAELLAMELDLDAADALAMAAQAHRRANRLGRARAAALRCRRLVELCEGASTPAVRALAAPAELTRREHEVAEMAVEGLSSAQIAGRLGRSVRTVDNHLQAVYSKLEVHGRDQLKLALVGAAPMSRGS
jgi:DNA-binding CsgD family transcriptional regulator